jgi:hypothetical protein
MSVPNTYEAWVDAINQQRLNNLLGRDKYAELGKIAQTSESALFEALKKTG